MCDYYMLMLTIILWDQVPTCIIASPYARAKYSPDTSRASGLGQNESRLRTAVFMPAASGGCCFPPGPTGRPLGGWAFAPFAKSWNILWGLVMSLLFLWENIDYHWVLHIPHRQTSQKSKYLKRQNDATYALSTAREPCCVLWRGTCPALLCAILWLWSEAALSLASREDVTHLIPNSLYCPSHLLLFLSWIYFSVVVITFLSTVQIKILWNGSLPVLLWNDSKDSIDFKHYLQNISYLSCTHLFTY